MQHLPSPSIIQSPGENSKIKAFFFFSQQPAILKINMHMQKKGDSMSSRLPKLFLLTVFALFLLPGLSLAAKPNITSDSNYFDINTGCYILEGNVRIETSSRLITADKAKVNITSMEVWGDGNISVTQDDITFTGNSVYVDGSSKEAVIRGNADLERTGLSIRSDNVKYNWQDKIATFKGNVQVNDNGQTYSADVIQYSMSDNKIL